MKRVLVTGGSGLVGGFVVEALHAAGWQVTIAGRARPDESVPADVGFRRFVLAPGIDHDHLLDGFDALVHAAFWHIAGHYRGGEGNDVMGFWDRNYVATLQLFEAAEAAGLSRVVFLSSRAVYGQQPPGIVLTEDLPCRPDTHYGLIKAGCEEHLTGRRFCGTSLRVTGVYGQPIQGDDDKWRPLFDTYLAGDPVEPRFGTEVHGHDAAAAVRLMLDTPTETLAGQVFNVSDVALDRHDLLALVQQQTGCPHALPPKADATAYNVMDTSKLNRLGWKPGGLPLLQQTVRELCADY